MPVVFKKTKHFDITKGNNLGMLPRIGINFVISFQFIINRFVVDFASLHNILHFTIGGIHTEYGDLTPALFIGGQDNLVVVSAINGKSWHYHNMNFKFVTKKWYTVEISQLLDKDGKVSI